MSRYFSLLDRIADLLDRVETRLIEDPDNQDLVLAKNSLYNLMHDINQSEVSGFSNADLSLWEERLRNIESRLGLSRREQGTAE